MADSLDAVIVVTSGNAGGAISRYPALYLDPADPVALSTPSVDGDPNSAKIGPLVNMIVVGSTDKDTYMSSFSQYAPWMTTL
jgi:hypothetical protein